MATSSRPLLAAGLLALALGAGAQEAPLSYTAGGTVPGPLPVFPADNWWNADVSAVTADATATAAFLSFVGNPQVHPDFGGEESPGSTAIYGMPYLVVTGDTPLEPMAFDYASQSDTGAPGRPTGYPIPVAAKTTAHLIEGGYPGNQNVGGDKHLLILDKDHRLLFETWNTRCLPYGSASCTWRAGSGAVFSLDSNHRRPEGWTSADAAGLAIFPGLLRWDEAYGSAPIGHALRVTVGDSNGYVYPASHVAGGNTSAPPLGARLRLKPGVTVSSGDAGVQKIVQAMKTFGLIIADNGSNMYVQGTFDTRWSNDVLNPALGQLHASDFEVLPYGWTPPATLPPGPLGWYPLTPCRVLDTRTPPGSLGAPALWPDWERTFRAAGQCGIPASARALTGNVTVTGATAAGELRLFAGNVPAPLASTINFRAGQTRANNLILGLSSAGAGTFTILNDATGTVDVLFDVNGYLR